MGISRKSGNAIVSDQILIEETESIIPMGTWVKDIGVRGYGVVYGYSFGYIYEFNPHGGPDDTAWPMAIVAFFGQKQTVTVDVQSLEIYINDAWVNGEALHQQIIAASEAKGWQRWGA